MLYDPSGAIRVTVVDGTSWTGLYAADGSLNVVVGSTGSGIYHPCGGFRVTVGTGGTYADDGSYIVNESPGTGAIFVVAVFGSL